MMDGNTVFAVLITVLIVLGSVRCEETAQGATVDPLFVDTVCGYETRGSPYPYGEVGDDGEVGECQVKPETAHLFGYVGPDIGLADPTLNRKYATLLLDACARRWRGAVNTIKHRGLPYLIAYCYNAGPGARLGIQKAHRYGKIIASLYSDKRRWCDWSGCLQMRIARR